MEPKCLEKRQIPERAEVRKWPSLLHDFDTRVNARTVGLPKNFSNVFKDKKIISIVTRACYALQNQTIFEILSMGN